MKRKLVKENESKNSKKQKRGADSLSLLPHATRTTQLFYSATNTTNLPIRIKRVQCTGSQKLALGLACQIRS